MRVNFDITDNEYMRLKLALGEKKVSQFCRAHVQAFINYDNIETHEEILKKKINEQQTKLDSLKAELEENTLKYNSVVQIREQMEALKQEKEKKERQDEGHRQYLTLKHHLSDVLGFTGGGNIK